jgi:hypothetical protein
VLRAAVAADPEGTRMAFFLGIIMHSLGMHEEALIALQHRINLGSWYLERFECHLRRVSAGTIIIARLLLLHNFQSQ